VSHDGFDGHSFASRLREARLRADIRQVAIADAMGTSPSRVSDWMRGKQVPKIQQLPQLARLLNVDLHWLVTGRERPVSGAVALIDEVVRATPTLRALAERGQALAQEARRAP
jgi:transcriptional regulator with XRE-family HTH domain